MQVSYAKQTKGFLFDLLHAARGISLQMGLDLSHGGVDPGYSIWI